MQKKFIIMYYKNLFAKEMSDILFFIFPEKGKGKNR